MTNLIEVVFENVAKSCVMQLLKTLIISWENITDVDCTESIVIFKDGQFSKKGITQFLDFDGGACVLIKIKSMKLEKVILPNVQLRLLKYGDLYDIEFNFDSNKLENTSMMILVEELHVQAKCLASKCTVPNFYCGMEPASDEETRYFTNDKLGPLAA